MKFTIRSSMTAIACAMILLVATQIFYMIVVTPAGPDTALRPMTWMIEMAAFTLIAATAMVLAARAGSAPLAWSAISIGGLLNMIQVGMGLAMFPPAAGASEELAALFDTILKGAFFFYFFGKVLFSLAVMTLGSFLLKDKGWRKVVGALAIITGLGGAVLGILAMPTGLDWMMPAGIAGTLASAMLALAILTLRNTVEDK